MSKRNIECCDSGIRKKFKKTKRDIYSQSKLSDSSSDSDDLERLSHGSYQFDDCHLQQSNNETSDHETSIENSSERSNSECEVESYMNNDTNGDSEENSEVEYCSDDSRYVLSENGSSERSYQESEVFRDECSSSVSSSHVMEEHDINECFSAEDESEHQETDNDLSTTFEHSGSENDTDDDFDSVESNLAKDLAYFAIKSATPQEYINLLLQQLRKNNVKNIPKSYATLVGTSKKKIDQRPVESGFYFTYKSIQDSLAAYEPYLKDKEIIEIDIGVDGFKPFKASKLDMWPIMGSVVGLIYLRPFLLGCYAGQKAPKRSDDLLKDLCDEIEILNEEGIYFPVSKKHVQFRIRLFCLDAPARAMVCGVMGHSSYEGCPICKMAERINDGKVVYTSTIGEPRTNETYAARLHIEHHKPCFRKHRCRLESMCKMVDQFPIDPMHCIELGDAKAMLELMKLKKTGEKIQIDEISSRMAAFRKPNDFSRDCRSLDYLQFFKATELRFFLFYGCVVFLKGMVDDYIYRHVLLLHCAVRLLSNDDLKSEDIDVAEELILEYVRLYPIIYGEENVTYNVHVLMHIPYFSRLYGSLDSFSMFKFENFIQMLKGFVRKAQHPLQQLSNRLDEFSRIIEGSEKFNSFDLNANNEKDSFIGIKRNGNIIPARFLRFETENGIKCVKVLRCLKTKSFYDWPVDSKQLGEISYENLSDTEETFAEKDIFLKYCRFPSENIFVLIPILHTSFLKFGDNMIQKNN